MAEDENEFLYNDDDGHEHTNVTINLEREQGSLVETDKPRNFWEWWCLARKAR